MGLFKKKKKASGPIGYLVFDITDPSAAPYLALDAASDLDEIAQADYVTLKVIRASAASQK